MSVNHPPLQPLDPQQMRQLANAQASLRAGFLPQAARQAETLTEEAPHAVDAWHIWALALAQGGDPEAAFTPFRRALELTPDNPALLANYAVALRRAGQREAAVDLWRQATGIAPQFAQAWLDLGLTELDLEHPEAAREALRRAVELMPASGPAWHGLGSALSACHEASEAEQAMRKAIDCDPRVPAPWISLGQQLRRQARVTEALACYEKALQSSGEAPELLDARAGALLDVGRVEEAIATARHMTTRYPQFTPGQQTLAQILWEYVPEDVSGESPLAGFAGAVEAFPGDANLRLAYTQLLRQTGQSEDALEHLAILRRQGDHPALWRAEADTLEALGRSGQAAPLYEALYRDETNREPGLFNAIIRHCLKTDQWQRAESLAAQAIAMDPANQEAWAYRGIAWRKLGDAREHWLCDYERLITMVAIDTPTGYADTGTFLDALRTSLLALHRASRQPVQQSLRTGTQTAGRLFGRDDPAIRAVEAAMRQAALRWIDTLPDDPDHPFLCRRTRDIDFRGSWSVKLSSSGHHVNHIHQEGWISTAFYVALPPSMDGAGDDAGCIQFGQPPADLGLDLPARRVLRPRPGHLALFPSYMWHGTVPFSDDEMRLSVACDITDR